MRIFSGFQVSSSFEMAFSSFRNQYTDLEKLRWTKTEKLHLTAWFYGEVPKEMLPNLIAVNSIISQQNQVFELPMTGVTLAPSNQNARMIWARYENTAAFSQLIDLYQYLIGDIGIVEKRFSVPRPHITLARFPEQTYDIKSLPLQDSKANLKENKSSFGFPPTLWAKELVLWESKMSTTGNQYAVLDVQSLKIGDELDTKNDLSTM